MIMQEECLQERGLYIMMNETKVRFPDSYMLFLRHK